MRHALHAAASVLALTAAVPFSGTAIAAQPYPTKAVRIIVGFPPGGTADILARIIGAKLADTWGQSIVIDNRSGAGSTLGAEIAARSSPDGYTLHFISSSYAASAGLYGKLNYDPVKSFAPISLAASTPQILIAHPSIPAKSLDDVLALAKASPGKFNYGSAGQGSTTHLAGELLWSMTGVKVIHVPYKGGALAMTDTIAGHIQYMMFTVPPALPHVKAGRVRAITVTSLKRITSLPDVQAAAEIVKGYEATNWYAALAPVGVPKSTLDRIVAGVRGAIKDPAVSKAIENAGADPIGGSPEELAKYLPAEIAKWTKVIKEANVSLKE